MNNAQYAMYTVLQVYRLSEFMYSVFKCKEIPTYLKAQAPTEIDSDGMLLDCVKRLRPELLKPPCSMDELALRVEECIAKEASRPKKEESYGGV